MIVDSDLRIASLGRSIGPALAARARPALLPARRASATPGRSRPAHAMSGGTPTSATAPTSSRWSSGCVRKLRDLGCPLEIRPCAGSGSALVDRRHLPRAPRRRSLDSTRGLLLGVRPGVRPGRRVHAAGRDRRPGGQRARPSSSRPAPATTTASRSRSSPSCRLCGYSIDDLFLQDTLLDAVPRRRSPTSSPGPPTCCRCSWSARRSCTAPASSTARWSIHRGRVLGVAPKSYLPTYREFYERRWFAPGDDRRGSTITARRRRGAVRARPDLRGDRRARPRSCTSRSARTCGCRSRRAPRPRWPAPRCSPTCPAARSPSPAPRTGGCWSAARARAARRRTSSPPPARASRRPTCRWDGQTMVYECGDLLGESERFPDGPRRTVVDVDLDRIRQERHPAGHVRRQPPHPRRAGSTSSAPSRSSCSRPTGDIGLRRKVDRFPFVPDDVERLALDCYEAYNIQVSGLEQRLHAIGQPKVVIGVSGGLDSTHALIVAAKAMDRLGRPRSDIHAFTLPGFATGDTTKSYATRLVEVARRDVRGDRHHRGRRTSCSPTSATRTPTARRSTTSPSRTSRPACAPTTSSGSPTTAAASCSAPATCPSSRSAGARTASATRCRTTTSTPASRRR